MTSRRFDNDPLTSPPLHSTRKAVRHSPPLPPRRAKDSPARHPKLKAGSHLIGSHVAPKLLKMQSLDQLPQVSAEENEGTQEAITPAQGSLLSPSSEMTSAGSSGFDPSSTEGLTSPRHSSGSILKPACTVKPETHKKVAFLPTEESEDEDSPQNEDLETAVIIRKSETHRKKKAKPARRAIMSYHANSS